MSAKETLKQWVQDYTEDLYLFATYKVSDAETIKDLVQDTFLVAYANYANYREESNPKTWLLAILKNKISDHYRSEFRQADLINARFGTESFFGSTGSWDKEHMPAAFETDTSLLDNTEFLFTLNDCLEKLPDKLNKVVQLKYYSEQNTNSICQDMGITTTNFWQMMHRAKLRLRECLEINWFKV